MKRSFRLFAAAAMALGLAACQGPASSPQARDTQPMQLKLYSVPPQQSSALLDALRFTAFTGKGSNVSQPFPGKLLVFAPKSEQASIGAAITELIKAADTSPRAEQLHVHFWLVDALPGSGQEPDALKPLSGTLNTLQKSLGPSHFSLQDSAMTTVTPGNVPSSITTGQGREFKFWLASAGAHNAMLHFNFTDPTELGFHHLETSTALNFGDYMVLAEAPNGKPHKVSLPNNPAGSEMHAQTVMRLLIVRVDPTSNAAH